MYINFNKKISKAQVLNFIGTQVMDMEKLSFETCYKNCMYSIDFNTTRIYVILYKCPFLVFAGGSPEKLHNILVCLHTHQPVTIAHQKCCVSVCQRGSVWHCGAWIKILWFLISLLSKVIYGELYSFTANLPFNMRKYSQAR